MESTNTSEHASNVSIMSSRFVDSWNRSIFEDFRDTSRDHLKSSPGSHATADLRQAGKTKTLFPRWMLWSVVAGLPVCAATFAAWVPESRGKNLGCQTGIVSRAYAGLGSFVALENHGRVKHISLGIPASLQGLMWYVRW